MSKQIFIKVINIFIFLFISLFFNLIFTSKTEATFILQPPGPFSNDTKNIQLTVYATDNDTFATNVEYSTFVIDSFVPEGQSRSSCQQLTSVKTTNPKELTVNLKLENIRSSGNLGDRPCVDLTGTWNFKVYLNPNSPILDTNFNIEQEGGGIPDIIAPQSVIRATDQVPLTLVGVNTKNGYTVWWDGDPRGVNEDITQDMMNRLMTLGNTLENFKLGLGNHKERVNESAPQRICMVLGNYDKKAGFYPGLTCKHSTFITFSQNPQPTPSSASCTIIPNNSSTSPTTKDNIRLIANLLERKRNFIATLKGNDGKEAHSAVIVNSGDREVNYFDFGNLPAGNYTANISSYIEDLTYEVNSKTCTPNPITFSVKNGPGSGQTGSGTTGPKTSAGGITCDTSNGDNIESLIIKKGKTQAEAENIIKSLPKERSGIYTAIGCIPTEPTALVQGILKFAVGAGGGVALLLMFYGAFQMITSSGNPDGVKKGHEQITSAVLGLLFIIFAVMLLKIIGVDILQIPEFGK